MNFLILVYAHLLGDYPLQGDFLANQKGNNFLLLITHAGIWAGTVALAGHLIGFDITLLDISLLFLVHALADWLKATGKLWYVGTDALKEGLLVDQLIHVVQILILIKMNK